jgi:hypothetical protein
VLWIEISIVELPDVVSEKVASISREDNYIGRSFLYHLYAVHHATFACYWDSRMRLYSSVKASKGKTRYPYNRRIGIPCSHNSYTVLFSPLRLPWCHWGVGSHL